MRQSLFICHFLHHENRPESPRAFLQTVNVLIVAKQERHFSF